MYVSKRKKRIFTNIILLLIVTLIAFTLAEVTLRGVNVLKNKDLVFEGTGLHEKYAGDKLGYGLKPNTHIVINGIDYSINEGGFRDDYYPKEKNSSVIRIVTIGDSISFGTNLNASQRYTELLENDLNAKYKKEYDVLNFGVSGYAPYQEIETLKRRGLDYHPNIVILQYALNDALVDPYLNTTLTHGCKINLLNIPINCKVKNVLGKSEVLKQTRALLKNDEKQRDIYIQYHNDAERFALLEQQYDELAYLGKEQNFKVVVVIVPVMIDYDTYPYVGIHQKLSDMFTSKGFTVVDMYPTFKEYPYEELRLNKGDPWHPNALGHELIAHDLEQRMIAEHIVP